jgi:RNA-directed DNA polymerase
VRQHSGRAHIIAYADDFVILSRGHAVEAMMWTKAAMTKLRVSLNDAKTSIRDAPKERFEFLGYSFGPHYWWKNGQRYLGASPSKKSVQRIKAKISDLLVPGNKGSWPEIHDQLNRLLSGWSTYFSHGTRLPAYRAIDAHVYDRVRQATQCE